MHLNSRRWSVWKTLLLYPLFITLVLETLCLWVVVDETYSPVRMIRGQPDDAPLYGAIFFGFLFPVLYVGYAALLGFVWLLVRGRRFRSNS